MFQAGRGGQERKSCSIHTLYLYFDKAAAKIELVTSTPRHFLKLRIFLEYQRSLSAHYFNHDIFGLFESYFFLIRGQMNHDYELGPVRELDPDSRFILNLGRVTNSNFLDPCL